MNWKSIIATAVITGVVTLATGILLIWWQTEKAELTYNSIQSIPFDDTSNKLFIQQVEISNSGNKIAENVVLSIRYSNEIIQKSKIIIDNSISHIKTNDDKSIKLNIDSLNPGEGANISILYQSSKLSSSEAKISLRAKGITGKSIGSNKESYIDTIKIALLASYAGLLAFFLSTEKGRKILPILLKGYLGRSLGNNQKHLIASTLSMYGYPEKAKEYLCSDSNRHYWVEADLLAAEAILNDDKTKNDIIKVLLVISELPNIAKSSKAITFYNIARLYKTISINDENIEKYLELAKEFDNTEIENRLNRDPLFS